METDPLEEWMERYLKVWAVKNAPPPPEWRLRASLDEVSAATYDVLVSESRIQLIPTQPAPGVAEYIATDDDGHRAFGVRLLNRGPNKTEFEFFGAVRPRRRPYTPNDRTDYRMACTERDSQFAYLKFISGVLLKRVFEAWHRPDWWTEETADKQRKTDTTPRDAVATTPAMKQKTRELGTHGGTMGRVKEARALIEHGTLKTQACKQSRIDSRTYDRYVDEVIDWEKEPG